MVLLSSDGISHQGHHYAPSPPFDTLTSPTLPILSTPVHTPVHTGGVPVHRGHHRSCQNGDAWDTCIRGPGLGAPACMGLGGGAVHLVGGHGAGSAGEPNVALG
eukprot:346754-Chlamydomonas_euryale.AAC.1